MKVLAFGSFLLGAATLSAVPPVPLAAPALPLADVRLTGGPLKRAQDLDREYLLRLEPDRMMYYLRQRAGLVPKAARGYGGWDGGDGKQLTGHIAGHYLSAVSLMWAATGDPRFKERADYLVAELKAVQEQQGDGYIGAITDAKGTPGKELFMQVSRGDIRSGGFDLNGLWSPWYTEHKLFAGLRDAYRYTGNRLALQVEVRFAEWVERTLAPLSDTQIQQMLNTEFGGMNEIAADLYADTGDTRWLALYERFQHRAVMDPLARGEDVLASKHANTQVPKLIGALARHLGTGNPDDLKAARFFWDEVALRHSFATGGHGRNEYFGPPGQLNAMTEGRTAETCNIYNMLKLTRRLFALQPDERYAAFHERALFNHILGSIDPVDGWTCYMVPVGRGVAREYETNMADGGFTCCTGSGMESHALHGDGLYYATADRLWVNVYAPSTAEWRAAGMRIELATDFPEGDSAKLTLHGAAPKTLTLMLRRPAWAGAGFAVAVNGQPVERLPAAGAYVEIARTWQDGDTVSLVLPKSLHLEPLPDNPARAAILWGPLVLAGRLGPQPDDPETAAGKVSPPVFVVEGQPLNAWVQPVAGQPGVFRTVGVGRDRDLTLEPFYRLHRATYAAYWDIFTPAAWQQRADEYQAEEKRRRNLEAATVAFVQPGEMQPETDHHYQGDGASVVRVLDRAARRGGKWISFEVRCDPAAAQALTVTFTNEERRSHSLEVLVDGERLASHTTERRSPEQEIRLVDVTYPLPAAAVQGQNRLTIRFEAAPDDVLPAILGIRVVRKP